VAGADLLDQFLRRLSINRYPVRSIALGITLLPIDSLK
jgi:hypothetical protein